MTPGYPWFWLKGIHSAWSPVMFSCPAEPVRPIDPAAWISHTTALTGPYPHYGKHSPVQPHNHTPHTTGTPP